MLAEIVLFEDFLVISELRGQVGFQWGVSWPVPCCQDVDIELDAVLELGLDQVLRETEDERLGVSDWVRGKMVRVEERGHRPHLDLRRILESSHDIPADVNVLEHALQFVGELGTALRFEFANGALLCIDGRALAQQKALGQIFLVKGLENVLGWEGQPQGRSDNGDNAASVGRDRERETPRREGGGGHERDETRVAYLARNVSKDDEDSIQDRL